MSDSEQPPADDGPNPVPGEPGEIMRLGALVRSYRTYAGWSQADLAYNSRIEQAHISRIESGNIPRPHDPTLDELARVLAARLTELAGQSIRAHDIAEHFREARDQKAGDYGVSSWAVIADDRLRVRPAWMQRKIWQALITMIDAWNEVLDDRRR